MLGFVVKVIATQGRLSALEEALGKNLYQHILEVDAPSVASPYSTAEMSLWRMRAPITFNSFTEYFCRDRNNITAFPMLHAVLEEQER